MIDNRFLSGLRTLSFVEGASTLILFGIAMPLKYVWGMPLAVRIVGLTHGVLFSLLIFQLWRAIRRVPLDRRLAGFCMVAAVVPFGPFIADRWLKLASQD